MTSAIDLPTRIAERLLDAGALAADFFAREAAPLTEACLEMADRLRHGGRVVAIGHGACAVDAQHLVSEFLCVRTGETRSGLDTVAAIDLSGERAVLLDATVAASDVVIGFGPPEGDPAIWDVLAVARRRGAMTFALPGIEGSYAMIADADDPYRHQELMWAVTHVIVDALRTFLSSEAGDVRGAWQSLADVEHAIRGRADADLGLRATVAAAGQQHIATAVRGIGARLIAGGALLLFGDAASAAAVNDWAWDCAVPARGGAPVPALSLLGAPATTAALLEDPSPAVIARQLRVHATAGDVALAVATTARSPAVAAGLEEARRRGLMTIALVGDVSASERQAIPADVTIAVSGRGHLVEEVQASIRHVVRELLEPMLTRRPDTVIRQRT